MSGNDIIVAKTEARQGSRVGSRSALIGPPSTMTPTAVLDHRELVATRSPTISLVARLLSRTRFTHHWNTMTATTENGQQLPATTHEGGIDLPDERSAVELGLSWLDQLATTALIDGRQLDLIALVRGSATSLAGPGGEEARLQLLSRAIAKCQTNWDLLNAGCGQQLRAGKLREAELLDRMALNATKRLTMLLAEHRAATTKAGRTAVIAVAHADAVHVEAGE